MYKYSRLPPANKKVSAYADVIYKRQQRKIYVAYWLYWCYYVFKRGYFYGSQTKNPTFDGNG